ncbi:MAG: hypothetical protein GYB65_21350 [Chloroflexi bacterium]|nr:hypothetical protein [Chloroflexota bacterium]
MKRYGKQWVMAVLMVMAVSLALVPAAHAQDDPYDSLTLTEGFINAALAEATTPGEGLTGLYVDLQPGQVILTATITGQQGNPLNIGLTMAPFISGGTIDWNATTLTINDFPIDLTTRAGQDSSQEAVSGLDDLVTSGTDGSPLTGLTVTDNALTLSWQRTNPSDPAVDIVDNDVSLTITEAYANTVLAADTPGMQVDFQPGQMTMTMNSVDPNAPGVTTVTFQPVIANGSITWNIVALTTDGVAVDAAQLQQNNLASAWRMFFTGMYEAGQLSDITFTETTKTLTWDGDLAEGNLGAFSSGGGTAEWTEAYINSTFGVTSSQYSDLYIDLQPGQVVMSANVTGDSGTVPETITFVPVVENGVIRWVITSLTINGQPLDEATIDSLNDTALTSWTNIIWQSARYTITSVTITDDTISATGDARY